MENPNVTPLLFDADLRGLNLREANLSGGILRNANLSGGYLRDADLRGTDLCGADISEAKLGGATLDNANLSGASLRWSKLGGAELSETILRVADLTRADLTGTYLGDADFSGANLSGADLSAAELGRTNLSGANLNETEFTGSLARGTCFADVDLSTAKGLETVVHTGPSSIGIDTVYRSHGKIPNSFLRGCGVPDEFIAYIGSMAGRRLEFYSCFISYSTHDQEFAERLHSDLQAEGVRCWFAPDDIKGGRKLHEQIDEAIRLHDKLLLILSQHSMNSEWVKTEIAKARKREVKDSKRVLFPLRLVGFEALRDWECFDADTGKDSAREIREYFIPDFSNWKDHASYQTAFQRLVSDLKAENTK